MKKLFQISLFIFISILQLSAQTTKDELLSDSRYIGGLYCPYIYSNTDLTPAPKGYKPFYISHYGRHGSRWISSDYYHTTTTEILGKADKAGKLTEKGKTLYEKMLIAAADAKERYGDLAPLGVKEEKEIAERMFLNYPEVFINDDGREPYVYSRSTQVPRCILSMAANNERLKELNPKIKMKREATKRDKYLNNEADINSDTVKVIAHDFLVNHFNPSRFISSIFNDSVYAAENVKEPARFAFAVFYAATNLANIDYLNMSMYDVFTDDELFVLWQTSNLNMYFRVGPSPINGKIAKESAGLLLRNIIECADSAIQNNNISADLRFGHDAFIIPLLALMEIDGMNNMESDPEKVYNAWSNFKVSPMGTNLQLVFFRKDGSDDVLVKFLHNEKEKEIPVQTDLFPFYHWKDVKNYYESKLGS